MCLARISHNQVENDVFHGMRGVRGMEGRVASLKRLRRAGMRVFSPPFCGRDGESLSIRARGGRRAPSPASCTRLHRAFTLVPGWPRSTGNLSSTGRRTRTPDGSAAWTPSRDLPCPVPHASREKHHFRLGYEKSGLNQILRLTPAQKRRLMLGVQKSVKSDELPEPVRQREAELGRLRVCTHCGSSGVVRYGKSAGLSRFRCAVRHLADEPFTR